MTSMQVFLTISEFSTMDKGSSSLESSPENQKSTWISVEVSKTYGEYIFLWCYSLCTPDVIKFRGSH